LKSVRGQTIQGKGGEQILATVHPSYLLRLTDKNARDLEYRKFVADLSHARTLAATPQMMKKEYQN
jgi:DNA polymerase